MTRYRFTLGAVSLAFALSAVPALAAGQAGSRPSGGSSSSGSAEPRGGGGGSTATTSSSSGGSASSGSSSGSSTTYSSPGPSYGRDSGAERAPQRPTAGERRGGEARPAGERAVPRGSAAGDPGRATASRPDSGNNRMSEPERRAVPAYSRPRDGRPALGTAGERTAPIPDNRRYGYFYNPYYGGYYYDPFGYYGYYNYGYYGYRNSFWWPGYGMGLSYFYDPFYDPFWYGGGGYGGGYSGYYGGYSGYGHSYRDVGAVRLKVKPRDAQVLVDGYFVGTVDDFDGVFQKLSIDSGSHRIELRAPGFAPVEFEVMITPGETVTYKGDLRRMQ